MGNRELPSDEPSEGLAPPVVGNMLALVSRLEEEGPTILLAGGLTAGSSREESKMPFVNIQILEGHPQSRKDEIARRVTSAISEAERVSELKKRAATK